MAAVTRSVTTTVTKTLTDPTTQFRVTLDPAAQTITIGLFYDDGTSEGFTMSLTDPTFTAADIAAARSAIRNLVAAALTAKGFR